MRSYRWTSSPSSFVRVVGLAFVNSSLLIATGCGIGNPATPSAADLSLLSGSIHGGQQAVTGATVNLYATTAVGYNGTPTLLGTTTTGSNGYFTFGAVTACTASQQAYIVATGGNPGLTGSVNNTALVLMAALGTCGGATGISSGTSIDVNELTTVAAAYALSGFMPAGGVGITNSALIAGTSKGVTTSSTNTQGLTDGMANASNMVSFANGTAYTTTPTGGTLTTAALTSLANALAACVNTNGSTAAGTACNSLFAAATPPTGSGLAAPVNTLQAILDIAAYPGNNVAAIYNVTPAFAAFGGGLAAAPNDWTLGITFTATNLVVPAGLTIDANDNVYTVGYPTSPAAAAALLEFSPQGTLLSPAAGWNSTATNGTSFKSSDNVREMKIDPSGNLFLSDGNVAQVIEYTPAGTATAPTTGTITLLSYATVDGTKNNWGIGIDTSGDVFSATYKATTCTGTPSSTNTLYCGLNELPAGNFAAPTATFNGVAEATAIAGSRDVAVDSANHLAYLGQNQLNTVYIDNYVTGTQGTVTTLPTCALPYGIAVDGNSYAWVAGYGNTAGVTTNCTTATVSASQLYQVNNAGTLLTTVSSASTYPAGITAGTPFSGAFYDIVDGNGNIFVANSLSSTIAEYSPSFNTNAGALLSPNVGFAPGTTYASGVVSGGTIALEKSIAIDRSGATWVLSPSTAGNLVQVFGASAPTNPVLSAGGYGVKP